MNLQGLIACAVQLFFAWRIKILTKSWVFCAIIAVMALAGCGKYPVQVVYASTDTVAKLLEFGLPLKLAVRLLSPSSGISRFLPSPPNEHDN
jgi:hypothetical protein